MTDVDIEGFELWYRERLRPFLAEYLQDKVSGLDDSLARIQTLNRSLKEELPICFLGASGAGKSTLINALVAGKELILPSGGIGPLTALAMEVRYGEVPTFEAEYHTARNLWQGIVFPLERGHVTTLKETTGRDTAAAVPMEFMPDGEDTDEIPEPAQSDDSEARTRLEVLRKQAQLLIKGNQDALADLPYLVDSLREAAGMKRSWGTSALPEDEERLRGIKTALALAKSSSNYLCEFDRDPKLFYRDLREHATGYLAPLIKELHVRWNSSLLGTGVVLVDLPGVGVAMGRSSGGGRLSSINACDSSGCSESITPRNECRS